MKNATKFREIKSAKLQNVNRRNLHLVTVNSALGREISPPPHSNTGRRENEKRDFKRMRRPRRDRQIGWARGKEKKKKRRANSRFATRERNRVASNVRGQRTKKFKKNTAKRKRNRETGPRSRPRGPEARRQKSARNSSNFGRRSRVRLILTGFFFFSPARFSFSPTLRGRDRKKKPRQSRVISNTAFGGGFIARGEKNERYGPTDTGPANVRTDGHADGRTDTVCRDGGRGQR